MNSQNKKLLTGITVFFKIIYILLIVICAVDVLSVIPGLFSKDFGVSHLTICQVINHPDVSLNIEGNSVQPDQFFGIGGYIVKGLPFKLKLMNSLNIIISLLIFIFILKTIRSIIKTLSTNEVFSHQNARRLRNIGYMLLAELLISYTIIVVNTFSVQPVKGYNLATFIGMIVGEATSYLIAIAFTFFIAAVFKIGVDIQEENQSIV
jgi:hypothetical protein